MSVVVHGRGFPRLLEPRQIGAHGLVSRIYRQILLREIALQVFHPVAQLDLQSSDEIWVPRSGDLQRTIQILATAVAVPVALLGFYIAFKK